MEPPNHDMHPMRVLVKIQKSEPPKFTSPQKWFVAKLYNNCIFCVVLMVVCIVNGCEYNVLVLKFHCVLGLKNVWISLPNV